MVRCDQDIRREFFAVPLQQAVFNLSFNIAGNQHRAAGAIDPDLTALDNDAWPDDVRQVANNIRNNFQVPVLFFVLVLALYAKGSVDMIALVTAWVFNPLKLMSRPGLPVMGRGKTYTPSRPCSASLATAGPPG